MFRNGSKRDNRMVWFVASIVLAAAVPVLLTARAWRFLFHVSSSDRGYLARFVLYINSLCTLLFVVVLILDALQLMTLQSVSTVAVPTGYLCVGISILSGIKIRDRLYRTVFFSSGVLFLEWLIISSLH